MKKTDLVMCNFWVAPAMRARLFVNDVPVTPNPVVGSHTTMIPINQRLLAGTNELSVEVEEWGDPITRERVDAQAIPRFRARIYKARVEAPQGEADFDVLAEVRVDAHWTDVAEEERQYPFFKRVLFDPEVPTSPPSYTAAEVVDVPCEGTPDLLDFVRAYHAATVTEDRDRMIELTEPYLSDLERAYPGEGVNSRGGLLGELDEVLAAKTTYRDLDEDELHYESRAGGRVVVVTRRDGGGVIRGTMDGGDLQMDLMVIKTTRGWRVM